MKNKWYEQWWGIVIICFVLLFFISMIFSVTRNSDRDPTTGLPKAKVNLGEVPSENIYLSDFDYAIESELIRFYFQIKYISGEVITPAGNLDYSVICNSDKNIPVYSKTLTIKSTDYITYQNNFTGTEQGKYYEFYIPMTDLKNCPIIADATQSVIYDAYGVNTDEHTIKIKFYNIDSNLSFRISNN